MGARPGLAGKRSRTNPSHAVGPVWSWNSLLVSKALRSHWIIFILEDDVVVVHVIMTIVTKTLRLSVHHVIRNKKEQSADLPAFEVEAFVGWVGRSCPIAEKNDTSWSRNMGKLSNRFLPGPRWLDKNTCISLDLDCQAIEATKEHVMQAHLEPNLQPMHKLLVPYCFAAVL